MLKIKDNVDLKELENKYFFHKSKPHGIENERFYYYNDENDYIDYYIWEDTRIIEINTWGTDTGLDNLLYNLIQADLVEKVGE